MDTVREQIDSLRALADNWDGEGAPRPAGSSIDRAEAVARWAEGHGLAIDVCSDVLGGVAVYLSADANFERYAWVSLLDGRLGATLLLSRPGAKACTEPFREDTSLERALAFLREPITMSKAGGRRP